MVRLFTQPTACGTPAEIEFQNDTATTGQRRSPLRSSPFPCVADEAALSPIVVTATRQAMRANELLSDVTVIEHDDIEQAGPSSTIAELLARQPGVEMVRNGSQDRSPASACAAPMPTRPF